MLTSFSTEIFHGPIKGNDISQLNAYPRLRNIYVYDLASISWPLCSFRSLEELIICPAGNSPWIIPYLPALHNLVIDYDNEGRASTFVDLTKLPQLVSFELRSYAHDLTILGQSQSLRKVTIETALVDLDFHQLGKNIEEVDTGESGLPYDGRHTRVQLPRLKSLTLNNSINFLPFLFPTNSCLIEEVSIELDEQDLYLGKLLELLNLQKRSTKLTKHDDSLTIFSNRVKDVIESVEWPVDIRVWMK